MGRSLRLILVNFRGRRVGMDGTSASERMDVVIQLGHQSLAHRMAMHVREGKSMAGCVGLGRDASEEGAVSRKKGAALVRIRGCTCRPVEFLEAMRASRVINYVIRVYFFPESGIQGSKTDLMDHLDAMQVPSHKVRIQASPPRLGKEVVDLLQERWDLDPKEYQTALSVVQLGGKYHCSMLPGNCMYRQPHNEPASTKGGPSRAVRKLQEAMELCNIQMAPGFTAIDVGAAPGSWTSHLVQCGAKQVFAIDPAQLNSAVANMPQVVHISKAAQDSSTSLSHMQCHADLLVCDMNEPPKTAARRAMALLPFLRQDGKLIVTMKFPGTGREHPGALEGVKSVLGDGVKDVEWHWLMANTLCERCLVAAKA